MRYDIPCGSIGAEHVEHRSTVCLSLFHFGLVKEKEKKKQSSIYTLTKTAIARVVVVVVVVIVVVVVFCCNNSNGLNSSTRNGIIVTLVNF